MAVTFACGFEAQQAATDNVTLTGTASYSTAQKRTGAASLRCNPASGASGYLDIASDGPTGYWSFGLYIATLPSVARVIAGAAGTSNKGLKLNSDGTLSYHFNGSDIGPSAALTTGVWYWIGYRVDTGTSVALLQIDGADAITGTTTGSVVFNATFGATGTEASALDIYFDDIILATAFLAPSKVDIALPISDNTRTAVTTNSGGTTNLWDCVNNTPPAGVASASEAAAGAVSLIYPASLTEDYIANLETYSTLGIAAGDTVLAVRGLVRHGEDIATGTKNLQNVGALTNPTVAGSSVTAGSDGGAHAAESGANFWVTTFGTFTASPSVTLGTSPTIRTSRTSESRVACIDFMGMVVAWTPAAATQIPRPIEPPNTAILAL